MSGKCPHCNRTVKSDTQICTPGVTPPTSPWMAALKSPLRSPRKSPKAEGGQSPTRSPSRARSRSRSRSPLRSPFKGSFFGASSKDNTDNTTTEESGAQTDTIETTSETGAAVEATSPAGATVEEASPTGKRQSRSPTKRGRNLPPWEVVAPPALESSSVRGTSPTRSLGRSRSPTRSPRRGSPANIRGASPPPALSASKSSRANDNTKGSLYVNVDMANDDAADYSPTFNPKYVNEDNKGSRSQSPTRSPAQAASYSAAQSPARGGVSPILAFRRSPSRSPHSGGSPMRSRTHFKASGSDEVAEQHQQTGYMTKPGGVGANSSPKASRSRSPVRGKSVRGTSSPGPATTSTSAPAMRGPHSPMHSPYKGSFFDNTPLDEEAVEGLDERQTTPRSPATGARGRSRSPLRSPIQSPFGEGRLRSPLRSPFNSSFFEREGGSGGVGVSPKQRGGGGVVSVGTE